MESEEKTEIGGIPVKVSSHRVMDQYAPFDSALELKALPCLSAVSYTHLDVYKRQVWESCLQWAVPGLGYRNLVLCTGYFECNAAYRTH